MSETTVIHVRDADFSDPNTIYIGRPVPRQRLKGSVWANPYRITSDQPRVVVLSLYRDYVLSRPSLMTALPTLHGKRLACWCFPEACHGNVLAELAEMAQSNARDRFVRQWREAHPHMTYTTDWTCSLCGLVLQTAKSDRPIASRVTSHIDGHGDDWTAYEHAADSTPRGED